jgi:hypothetical protein
MHDQPADSAARPDWDDDAPLSRGTLPDDAGLPPVEPPSAGFIVQLFVVPALIVAAVLGVYLLFGKLASSEVDWRELVADLRSTNAHTRWRGAHGLAQLLEADSHKQDDQPRLASDPELAQELSATLSQELDRPQEGEDRQRLLEYLVKSLGWMDVPQTVLPTLRRAIEPKQDDWLRQQALVSIGMVAGRAMERAKPVDDPALVEDLAALSTSSTDVLRHLAVYDLGFLPSQPSQQRLRSLLDSPDPKTRANAAVGLARQGATEAIAVFEEVLEEAGRQEFDRSALSTEEQASEYFERVQQAGNALNAAVLLKDSLSPEQTTRLIELIEPLTKVADAELRHRAIESVHALRRKG